MIHVVGKPAPSSQCFKQLGQYASSLITTASCYAELAVFSSLAVAARISSTHCSSPRRDGQAKLTWVVSYIRRCTWSRTPDMVTHPITNRAWHRVTSLIETNALSLSQKHY